jgi:hypothetical protein
VIQRDPPTEPGAWNWLRHHAPVTGCVIGVITTIVVASKPGASSHHLLPFGPVFAWLIADAIKRAADGADAAPEPLALVERPGAIIVLCDLAMIMFIVFAAYPMVSRNAPVMRQMLADRARNQMILAEINEIERRHPGRRLAIGYGSPDDAGLFNFRQVLVYRGHPNLIDHNAYMDMKFAGLPLPEATLRAIDSCEVEIWLLPRDSRPFEWWNLYAPYDELFPDALRAQFRARFEPREQTEHFDLWFCKSAA